MGSKTVYNPPKIEKDDSFAKYLEYQQGKEDRLQEQRRQIRLIQPQYMGGFVKEFEKKLNESI